MSINQDLDDPTKNKPFPRRVFRLTRDKGIRTANSPLRAAFRAVTWIFGAALLLFTTNGCLATRNWVNGQLDPIKGQLGQTDAKADQALAGLQNLHLEKKLVLDANNGPNFAFASAGLTDNAKRQIDGFFDDLGDGSANSSSAPASSSGRVFVVAGHTDSVGSEDYNYQLGQQRADRVAGYLVSKEGVDPTQIRVISYGASKPVADNGTSNGRRQNRRVEILVYQEKITSGSNNTLSDAGSDLRAVE